jgi:RNA polymerase sigma factor (sigma-70 family)
MNNIETLSTAAPDAELVAESIRGNREAFAAIVARYQSLVCSLTYSATGDLARSEDLAQETFIAAWKSLRGLKEPAKLRSWLCGIARNLAHNNFRREQRQPTSNAEEISAIAHAASPEPLPSERAISQEEQSLMWRALGDIPETYREPLIMFYREQQSIERVASALDLSEDAVKQRLSRGRKLLSDQVAAFVEGTLRQSGPGRAFTYGVIAALPMLALAASAATVGAAAVKGSTAAKGLALGAFAGAILGPIAGILGGWIGVKASLANAQSDLERQEIRRGAKITIVYVLSFLVILVALIFSDFWHGHAALWATLQIVLWAVYIAGLFAFITITNRRLVRIRMSHSGVKTQKNRFRFAYQSKLRFLGFPSMFKAAPTNPAGQGVPLVGSPLATALAAFLLSAGSRSVWSVWVARRLVFLVAVAPLSACWPLADLASAIMFSRALASGLSVLADPSSPGKWLSAASPSRMKWPSAESPRQNMRTMRSHGPFSKRALSSSVACGSPAIAFGSPGCRWAWSSGRAGACAENDSPIKRGCPSQFARGYRSGENRVPEIYKSAARD